MQPEELWINYENIGYISRNTGQDGLKTWKQLKDTVSDSLLGGQISDELVKIINRGYMIGHDDVDHRDVTFTDKSNSLDSMLHNVEEIDHFFIQHLRIPILANLKLTRRKFAQIAYNAGQFRAEKEKNTYNQDVVTYYDKNNLGNYQTYYLTDVSGSVDCFNSSDSSSSL